VIDQLALALAVIFAINLLPAFGSPDLGGAGLLQPRLRPATGAARLRRGARRRQRQVRARERRPRRLRPRLSAARVASLDRAQRALSANRLRAGAGLGAVALDALTSPLGMAARVAMLAALTLLAGGFRPAPR
jgi:hypothetical protein